jgi:hypothetical protein
MLDNIIKLLPNKYKINKDSTMIFIKKDVNIPILVYLDDKIFITLNIITLKEINYILKILNRNNIEFYLISPTFRKIVNQNNSNDMLYELLHSYYYLLQEELYYKKISDENMNLINKCLLNTIRLYDNGMKLFSEIHKIYSDKCDTIYYDYYTGRNEFNIPYRKGAEYIKTNKRRILLSEFI